MTIESRERTKALEHCHGCNRLIPMAQLYEADVLVAKQTRESPAEYDTVLVCRDCFMGGDRDDRYERANVVWARKHGGEL